MCVMLCYHTCVVLCGYIKKVKSMEKKYKKILENLILEKIPHCRIYLFGSRARGTAQSGADIDLALDAGEPIAFDTLCVLQDAIEQTDIPVFVDLVDLATASDLLKNEVIKEGIVWENHQ
ncbi:MAG: polymerase beta domain protein region protein [candidate division TM6 bacterium GW2011_GWF2_38_10]|nr:MAG: polymerase beta domain protein region protein [candidate division TM6 bacterium GW2011_GWF2_38_10]